MQMCSWKDKQIHEFSSHTYLPLILVQLETETNIYDVVISNGWYKAKSKSSFVFMYKYYTIYTLIDICLSFDQP